MYAALLKRQPTLTANLLLCTSPLAFLQSTCYQVCYVANILFFCVLTSQLSQKAIALNWLKINIWGGAPWTFSQSAGRGGSGGGRGPGSLGEKQSVPGVAGDIESAYEAA